MLRQKSENLMKSHLKTKNYKQVMTAKWGEFPLPEMSLLIGYPTESVQL